MDSRAQPLNGDHMYVLRFEAGQLPAVSVFWNMAMYASDMLFLENDFGRYSIGITTDGLKRDSDGSLSILIQRIGRPTPRTGFPPPPDRSTLLCASMAQRHRS